MTRRTPPPAALAPPPLLAPRFAAAWASLLYAVLTLTLAYPMLGGRFLVNPYSDEYIAGYAFREFGAATLSATGAFPLWNPYLFGGMPFVAAMHGDIFYPPTVLLRAIMPTDLAMSVTFALHVFIAGLGTYLFLRAIRLGFFASLVGGAAYMLSGPIASYPSPGHDGKLYVSAMLPLLLLLIYRGVRGARPWAWGAIALVVGLAVLSPHPQMLQYMLLVAGAFALWCAFASIDDIQLERPVAVRRLAYALGGVLLGAAIGAIQYLPVREYVPWSPRAGGKGWDHAISYSMPVEEMVNMWIPQFTGMLESYWGRNGIHLHSEYLGPAMLMLAFLGVAWRAPDGRRSFSLFWIGAGIVALLWALGGNTPFYNIVYAIVPGTKFFRAPSMILFIVAFAVAVLAALGADRVLARRYTARYALGWLAGAAVVALIATAGGLTNVAHALAGVQRYELVSANASALVLGAWRTFAFAALMAGLLLLFQRGRVTARVAAWALVGIVALDLWTVGRRYWMFTAPASELFAVDPTITYLQNLPEPGRVLAAQLGPSAVPNDPYYGGDALMSHRVRSVLGYHGNEIGRYDILGAKAEGWREATNPKFWQLMNVRYFLTNVPELPIEGAVQVAGPARNSAGSDAYLFRLPGDNPAAWVAPVIVKAPDDVVLTTLRDPRFDDVRRAALFDTSAAVTAAQNVRELPPPLAIKASVPRYEPGRISVKLDAPAPAGSALVVSENYYPGWTATSSGKSLPIGRVDFTLIGVQLPAGATQIELRFDSAPFHTGKTVTLVAMALSLVLTAFGLVVARRSGVVTRAA